MREDIIQEVDFVREATYSAQPEFVSISQALGGGQVTTVNGITGAVAVDGGTTGMSFGAAAPNITMGGMLVVANGGTGAATAAGARTNLGIDTIATCKSNLTAAGAPGAGDDSSLGYSQGSFWIEGSVKAYMCVNASVGAAVWVQIGP